MVRILRVVQEYLPQVSGPANLVDGLSRALASAGWDNDIYTCNLGTGSAERERSPGITVRRFPAVGPVMSSYFSPRLAEAVRRSNHDIIHVHGCRNLTADSALLLARGRPVVFQPHGILAGYKRLLAGRRALPFKIHDAVLRPMLLRLANPTLASTEAEREECIEWGIPQDQVTVIPEGVDDALFAIPERAVPREPFLLLYVGRISRDRDVEALIGALAHVRRSGVSARLRLVGRASESTKLNAPAGVSVIRELCQELGVATDVDFVGELTGSQLRAEYQAASLFVYASRYDSFGQALAQAAAAGLPIVSVRIGVAPELIQHGESGWLSDDPKSFGALVSRVLKDPYHMSAAGRAARKTAQRFRWKAVGTQYERYYTSLLGRGSEMTNAVRP